MVEFFAVEGAEFHVALNDAVEVGFLRLEVVESAQSAGVLVQARRKGMVPRLAFAG